MTSMISSPTAITAMIHPASGVFFFSVLSAMTGLYPNASLSLGVTAAADGVGGSDARNRWPRGYAGDTGRRSTQAASGLPDRH